MMFFIQNARNDLSKLSQINAAIDGHFRRNVNGKEEECALLK